MDKKLTDSEIVKALECEIECNKGLKKHCIGCLLQKHYPYCEEKVIEYALDLINRLQAENERLQKANEMFTDIGKLYSEIKSEAYKEFAERLKMRAINRYNEFEDYQEYPYATIAHIDNLLKEMVGEDK